MLNPRDAIIAALTPGTPFNPHGYVFRSVSTLAQFAGVTNGEVMELILGDLSSQVQCKPNNKHPEQGVYAARRELAALESQTQAEAPKIKILAGNAVQSSIEEEELSDPETMEEGDTSLSEDLTEEASDSEGPSHL